MISFVYFDVGGVLAIDFSGNDGFTQLGKEMGVPEGHMGEFMQLFIDEERACCTTDPIDMLLPHLEKTFGITIPQSYSLLDGFVRHFHRNDSIWPVVEYAKSKARVGTLTNMYVNMFRELEAKHVIETVAWDVMVDSTKVGYIKPDKEIFLLAQEKAGVPAGEILFVENSQKHIDAARELGWQTFLYDPKHPEASSEALLDYLKNA